MQHSLPLMCVIEGPSPVSAEIVSTWRNLHDAIVWAFDNRKNAAAKPRKWMAENAGLRPQHLTRLLDRRDLKLDAVQSHVWDCLTGWAATAQFVDTEKQRIAQQATDQLAQVLKSRLAA